MKDNNVAFTSLGGGESSDKAQQGSARRVKKFEETGSPFRPPLPVPTKQESNGSQAAVVCDDYTKSHPFPELELPTEQNRFHRNSQTLDSTLIASGSPYRGGGGSRRSTARSSQFGRSVEGVGPSTSDESRPQPLPECAEDVRQHSSSPATALPNGNRMKSHGVASTHPTTHPSEQRRTTQQHHG